MLALEALVATLLVLGAGFALVGSFGLAKLGDFFKRLHGPSKATTLGVGCVLLASAIWFAALGEPSAHELLVILVLFITAPVSAQLLVMAALALAPPQAVPPPPPPPTPDAASTTADIG